MRSDGLVVGVLAVHHWDLGSNPRSTQNSYIIFHDLITCRLQATFYHVPPLIQTPSGLMHQSSGQKMMNTMFLVNPRVDKSRKSERLGVIGPELPSNPPKKPNTPLVYYFFFYFPFLLFSFNYNYYHYYY